MEMSTRRPSSERKRQAVLDAAEEVFVRDGYDATVVDEIAERSGVAKQTIYAHFGSKRGLFVEVVTGATTAAFAAVRTDDTDPVDADDLAEHLLDYGLRQLDVVLRPRLLGLRRLAIAEARRFPDIGRAFWSGGPERTVAALRERFARLHAAGLLDAPDPEIAARTFNWLLMAAPLNAAMLLGDDPTIGPAGDSGAVRADVAEAVRVFLAAYAR